MITDLFRNLFSTQTVANLAAVADSLSSQEVFYGNGPRGENFYGAATLEQLNNVHLHYESGTTQTPSESKMRITNGSNKDIWINYHSFAMIWPQTLKIASGQTADYNIPASQSIPGVRYWPKYDCDSDGQNCTIGESGGSGLPC